MKKLIIDRKTWVRGNPNGDTYLLRPVDEKKCCIGFYAEQICGFPKPMIWGEIKLERLWERLEVRNNEDNRSAIKALQEKAGPLRDELFEFYVENDRVYSQNFDSLSPEEGEKIREKNISDLFAKYDIEVEYVN